MLSPIKEIAYTSLWLLTLWSVSIENCHICVFHIYEFSVFLDWSTDYLDDYFAEMFKLTLTNVRF